MNQTNLISGKKYTPWGEKVFIYVLFLDLNLKVNHIYHGLALDI